MELKFEAPWKNELFALDKYNVNGKDESITVRNEYPRHSVPYFDVEGFDLKKEFMLERGVKISKSRANDIIIPHPTPQWVSDTFLEKYDELEPILVKDSARRFLRLFENCAGIGMSWNLTIAAQTLTFIVSFNALRCAKVLLEGKAPELCGMHANPNCINKYGYFALHEAAKRFSVGMVKLLLRHGASANVRTVGNDIMENLLPLHVAVDNTCLHNYLEDNLSRGQNHLDYIYKLIHLLCLPEMKICLDTTRLLAQKTNNLLQELWKYIEDGKLIQSAVLLLAAQEQIRRGSSSKINGSSKKNGFDIINTCIVRLSFALKWEKGSHGMAPELLEERKTLIDSAWLLVDVISHAGEDLSAYIQAHSEVPHVEVLQCVSSILREYGFCPTGDSMDTIKLRPYDSRSLDDVSCKGLVDANMAVMGMANLDAAEKKKNGRMELKFEAPRKNELLALDKYNVNGKDELITVRTEYPRHPVPHFDLEGFDVKKVEEFMLERAIKIAKSRANDIIIPDPAPKWVSSTFMEKYAELEPIFLKDSVRCFLRVFKNCAGSGMSWNLTVSAQTLTFIVSFDALRCAKVVLEGKAPELYGMHANPNCINKYGYFALHEAAERFSVDMIKLLLRHGASTNVRTVGNDIIENLLPLHVAVENTCLHKYLEDNLSRGQNHLDYIYKLIHLLCLPEMKIFLDTTRLLAEKTNNLLPELWKYIEDGKLVQSAVLLLAAQEQIRRGSSSKINGSSKKNGFDIINKCIVRLSFALKLEKGSHGMAQELLEERKALIDSAWLLVDVISHAGEDLSAYIQAHSEVPHVEVFQHVSSILKEYGFCPTGHSMDTFKLQPYDCRNSDGASCKGLVDANMADMGTANLDAAKKKAVRKIIGGGWDPTYARRDFFPYWRSVLQARFPVKIYPAYANEDPKVGLKPGQLCVSQRKPISNGSTPIPNHTRGSVQGIVPPRSNYQPRRCFITAATGALRLLKVLK